MANEIDLRIRVTDAQAIRDLREVASSGRAIIGVMQEAGSSIGRFSAGLSDAARRAQSATEAIRRMNVEARGGGAVGGGGGGGAGGGGGGFFLGALKANLVGYIASEARDLGGQVLGQQIDLSRANVGLAQSAKEAGVSIDSQRAAAKALSEQLNINIVDATQLTGQTTRLALAAGLGADKSDDLAKALANSLAASGRSLSELPSRLQQLATGQDELFDVIGGVRIGGQYAASPDAIYKATAAQKGLNRELTDTEKLQARINAVLVKGAETQGAATGAITTMAGQYEFFKNDVLKGLSDAVDSYSRDFEKLTGFRIFGDVTDKAAEDLQKTQLFVKQLEDELTKIDAFRAGLGIKGFEGVGQPGGVLAPGAAERVRGFDAQAREQETEARASAVAFADRQRAERERSRPQRLAQEQAAIEKAGRDEDVALSRAAAARNRFYDLETNYESTGFKTGAYGQVTDEVGFRQTFGEKTADRAARVFADAQRYASEFYESPEDRARFARQLRLEQTSGLSGADLSDEQRRQLQQDTLAIEREALDEAKAAKLEFKEHTRLLKKIAGEGGQVAEDGAPEKRDRIIIENRSDKLARLGDGQVTDAPLFGSDDGLSSF